MRKIFVIGNIGSGKSTFSKMLEDELNAQNYVATLIDLDKVSNAISSNKKIQEVIQSEFPECKSKEDLAKTIFRDKSSLDRLEGIIHPYVMEDMIKNFDNLEELGADFAIVEQTAYKGVSDKFTANADIIVCVICDDGLRQARSIERGIQLSDFIERTSMQLSQMTMMENADVIISNNDDAEGLRKQVLDFIDTL